MPEPSPSSILIIRPSALGDVCRTVPVLASLRAAWPDARLGWLVQKEFTEAVSAHPALDEVISFPRQDLRGAWRSPGRLMKSVSFLRSLRHGGWDLVLDCQGLARSGLFAWSTRARHRVGFADADELGWLYLTEKVQPDSVHTVDRMMALVDALGIERQMDMRLYAPSETERWWQTYPGRSSEPYAVLAPKSRWPGKEWPADRWHALAEQLSELGIRNFILVGSGSEQRDVDQLTEMICAQGFHAHSLAGRTTVGQLMRVIQDSDLVVANDSAPLHMAVGFGRPLVGIFGVTDPAKVGPYDCDRWVVRGDTAPADGRAYRNESRGRTAMESVTVSDVFQIAKQALEEKK